MTRLPGLFRVTSSATAVVLLIAFNLVPLAGVLWWGWNVYTLLILYWLENGIIGVLNVPKILRAEGPIQAGSATFRVNGLISRSRGAMVAFFAVHYGIFWTVHGVFVFLLPLFIGLGSMAADATDGFPSSVGPASPFPSFDDPGLRFDVIVLGAVGLAISHTASFFLNFLGRGEYRHVSPVVQTIAPYGRVIVLHLAILLGAFLSVVLGSPVGAAVVLVIGKTIVDLALHLGEHRRAAARSQLAG